MMESFSEAVFSLNTCIFCTKECSTRLNKRKFNENGENVEKVKSLIFSKEGFGGFRSFFWQLIVGEPDGKLQPGKNNTGSTGNDGLSHPSGENNHFGRLPVCSSCMGPVMVMKKHYSELERLQLLIIHQVEMIQATVNEARNENQRKQFFQHTDLMQFQEKVSTHSKNCTRVPFVLLERFHNKTLGKLCVNPDTIVKKEPIEDFAAKYVDVILPDASTMDEDADWSPPVSEADDEDVDGDDHQLYVPTKRRVGRPRKETTEKRPKARGRPRKTTNLPILAKRPVGRPRKSFITETTDESSGLGDTGLSKPKSKNFHRLLIRKYTPVAPDKRKKHFHAFYRCEICGKSYFKRTAFLKHKRAHEEDNSELIPPDPEFVKQCSVCQTEVHQSNYFEHLLSHEEPGTGLEVDDTTTKPYACTHKDCIKKFSIEENLKIHMDVDHDEISSAGCLLKVKKCDVCNICYNASNDLLEHFKRVHKELVKSLYFCPVCAHSYTRSENLISHMFSHKNRDQQICFVCKEGSANRAELLAHLEQVHNLSTTAECEACKKSFNDVYLYNYHLKNDHKRQETFVCSFCGKVCYFHFSFMKHLAMHTKIERRNLRCETCNEAFATEDKLSYHRVKFHDAPKLICVVCNLQFLTPSSLELHTRKHTKEGYHCDICDKYFTQKANLTHHNQTVHSTERPFACEICGYTCKALRLLQRHQEKHIKRYSCDVCGRKFSRNFALKTHMRMHTGETIVCNHCGYEFHSMKSLRRHVKAYHDESGNTLPLYKPQKIRRACVTWKDKDKGTVHYAKNIKHDSDEMPEAEFTGTVSPFQHQQHTDQKPQTAAAAGNTSTLGMESKTFVSVTDVVLLNFGI